MIKKTQFIAFGKCHLDLVRQHPCLRLSGIHLRKFFDHFAHAFGTARDLTLQLGGGVLRQNEFDLSRLDADVADAPSRKTSKLQLPIK